MANVYRNGVKITPDNLASLLQEAHDKLNGSKARGVAPEPIDAIGAVLVYPPTKRRK